MKANKKIVNEVSSLINKIKKQDIVLGLYIEDHIVFNSEKDTVLYLGKDFFK